MYPCTHSAGVLLLCCLLFLLSLLSLFFGFYSLHFFLSFMETLLPPHRFNLNVGVSPSGCYRCDCLVGAEKQPIGKNEQENKGLNKWTSVVQMLVWKKNNKRRPMVVHSNADWSMSFLYFLAYDMTFLCHELDHGHSLHVVSSCYGLLSLFFFFPMSNTNNAIAHTCLLCSVLPFKCQSAEEETKLGRTITIRRSVNATIKGTLDSARSFLFVRLHSAFRLSFAHCVLLTSSLLCS